MSGLDPVPQPQPKRQRKERRGDSVFPTGSTQRRELRPHTSAEELLFGGGGGARQRDVERDIKDLLQLEMTQWDTIPTIHEHAVVPGDFWRDNESRMPNVARIARWLLSCSPSTAATERLFSSAGRVFTKARPRLSERGHNLLECHWNRACGFKGDS